MPPGWSDWSGWPRPALADLGCPPISSDSPSLMLHLMHMMRGAFLCLDLHNSLDNFQCSSAVSGTLRPYSAPSLAQPDTRHRSAQTPGTSAPDTAAPDAPAPHPTTNHTPRPINTIRTKRAIALSTQMHTPSYLGFFYNFAIDSLVHYCL